MWATKSPVVFYHCELQAASSWSSAALMSWHAGQVRREQRRALEKLWYVGGKLEISAALHHSASWKVEREGRHWGTQELMGTQRVLQVVPVGQVLAEEDVQVHSIGSLGCLNSYLLYLFCRLCEIRAWGGLTPTPDIVKQLSSHTATVSSAHSQPPSWHRAGRSWDRQEQALLSYQCLMGASSVGISLQRAGRS